MVALLGFLGVGIDLGFLRAQKRQIQMLADAAALAGAAEHSYCSTSGCSALTTAAQDALTENGFTGSTLVTQAGGSCTNAMGSGSLVVAVNNPPCFMGSTANDPHYGDANYVETVVLRAEPLMFATIFGIHNTNVSARSVAALGSSSNCIYALGPSGIGLSVSGSVSLNLPNCSIFINSSSSDAVDLAGSGSVTAQSIDVVGTVAKGGGTSISPAATTGVTAKSDPLAYLTPPTYSPCTSAGSVLAIGSTTVQTITPGNYCGGITIGNSAVVTFNAGNYVVAKGIQLSGSAQVTLGAGTYVMQGGGFAVGNSAAVTGTGVTFFLTGTSTFPYGPVAFTGAGNIQLTAPTTGTDAGILFYQYSSATGATSPTSGNTSNFGNSAGAVLQGALYFPTTNIDYSGAASAQYTILDAYAITISNSATINSNYSSLPGGSPIKGTGAMVGE